MAPGEKYSRIYLMGYMGSGKSTLGKRLANKTGYNFIDTDQVFEQRFKTSIHDYFRENGEENFRNLERSILHETFDFSNTIISTGGGTPCFYDNLRQIKKNGFSIYLRMSPEALYQRLMQTKRVRPLTAGLKEMELMEFIRKNLKERELYYEQADMSISGINLKSRDLEAIINYYTKHPDL